MKGFINNVEAQTARVFRHVFLDRAFPIIDRSRAKLFHNLPLFAGDLRKYLGAEGFCDLNRDVARAFLDRGYNVVANSRTITNSGFVASERLALVDGNIGKASTAEKIAGTAIRQFGSIDGVVNNAGIFFTKPFTEYTTEDLERLSETNLEGYIYVTQLAVKQMLAQKTGGSVTCVSSAMVEHPIAGVNASLPMVTKGGLEALTRSLAIEYAKERIRFNAVAPGVVDTPMHANGDKDALKSLSPMGMISDIDDVVDAIVYLTEARQVTGEVLHVDAGAHNGKW